MKTDGHGHFDLRFPISDLRFAELRGIADCGVIDKVVDRLGVPTSGQIFDLPRTGEHRRELAVIGGIDVGSVSANVGLEPVHYRFSE